MNSGHDEQLADQQARHYLLHHGDHSDRDRMQLRLLSGDDALAELQAAETDLLDEYVRDLLPPDDRRRFELHVLPSISPIRLGFARSLAGLATRLQPAPVRRSPVALFALAASLLLMTGLAVYFQSRASRLQAELQVAHARVPATFAGRTVTALLAPSNLRSTGAAQLILAPPRTEVLELQMEVPAAGDYQIVTFRDGAEILALRGAAEPVESAFMVRAWLPASAGLYQTRLKPVSSDVPETEFRFSIRRQ